MRPEIPDDLRQLATRWHELGATERRDVGRALRTIGLTYREIREIIPVPKSTLSNWCRNIKLADDRVAAIRTRIPSQRGVPRDTQRKRRAQIRGIRSTARAEAAVRFGDPLFAAGVVLYWAEGSKTQSDLTLSNTDPALLRVFIRWVRLHLAAEAEFRLSLHLHESNTEHEAKDFWRRELSLPTARFTKTYIKPAGTGHRNNRLPYGVCRVRVCRSTDMWHSTMAWIEHVRDQTH